MHFPVLNLFFLCCAHTTYIAASVFINIFIINHDFVVNSDKSNQQQGSVDSKDDKKKIVLLVILLIGTATIVLIIMFCLWRRLSKRNGEFYLFFCTFYSVLHKDKILYTLIIRNLQERTFC